jgi:hypothetical protein
MVVLFVVPSTRTSLPVVTALADAGLDPFWYVVAGALSTVTFWPAGVVIVKLDADTLVTVPADPPAAGPDRALDPLPDLPPAKPPPGVGLPADEDEDEDEGEDAAQPAHTPSTAHPRTPAAIRRLFRAGMISPSSQLSADGGDCRHRSRGIRARPSAPPDHSQFGGPCDLVAIG